LPGVILVAAGERVGEDREGDRPESREAGEYQSLFGSGGPPLLFNPFEGTNRGEDVADLGLFAADRGG
jgi:hypothetical protein